MFCRGKRELEIALGRKRALTRNRVVKSNMTSALILEDDADWDIRVKSQLQVFAQAARPFTQPTPVKPHKPVADLLTYDTQVPPELSLAQIPSDLVPKLTPYGDDWDVLWLGHCGTELPKNLALTPTNPEGSDPSIAPDPSHHPPQLRIRIPNDPTVPEPEHLKAHPFALNDALGELYPPHTRIVHASSATTCTQAYAVSQYGAQKLLWQFGLQTLTAGWDLMLRDWCDGLYVGPAEGNGRKRPVCVTVSPPLFSHHFGKGAASDITAPGGGFVNKDKEMTPYVRLSVRLNMGSLVAGAGLEDLVDQFPDKTRA
ncbi:hypothetical protein B0H67DRAFT_588507 [Lasiosphaeris hirsuta]|uniref:Uncharacterized protein n=1 Tax=Lasiosphaeris hirsuta TaxID=260670 RepID=A0AA40A1U8_9PEZI|nr:hypothetical protein B0H67DRAFT_588507 [Lasiosphaeris hirsuta]